MADPIMMAVATALAVRTAEMAVTGGPAAWQALVQLVRRRFAGDRTALTMLAEAQAQPDDPQRVQALAGSIDRIAAADGEFDAELRALWAQVGNASQGDDSVVNQNSGTVTGSLLQGRDFTMNGHLHFGGSTPPR